MGQDHRRFLWVQQAVSAVLNALISALFVWIVFGSLARVGLWGLTGLAADLVPTTFMITLMTAVALTLVTRAAVAKGQLAPVRGRSALPRSLVLRAPLLALGATAALVPLAVLVLWSIWGRDWTYREVLLFKIVYGVALGALVTPLVIGAALKDQAGSVRPA